MRGADRRNVTNRCDRKSCSCKLKDSFLICPNDSVYLELERPSDLVRLREPELYLRQHSSALVILDEVKRRPGRFLESDESNNVLCKEVFIDITIN